MKKIFLVLATILAAAACQKPVVSVKGQGEGFLSLGVNITAPTKASLSTEDLVSSARVNIYYADFSGMVRTYTYGNIPEVIYLPCNDYRVDVIAGEASKANPAPASWEQKSYKGSSPFTIAAGANTSVTVDAKINNVITNITFDETIAENFAEGYTFTIGLTDVAASNLVYTAETSGKDGYFLIGGLEEPSFSWTFSGVKTKDGSSFTKTGTIAELKEGTVYKMAPKFTVKDGDLVFDANILVDTGTDVYDEIIVFEPVSTGISKSTEYEIWAGHATVHADVDETEHSDPSKIKFKYTADGQNWIYVDATRTDAGVYDAVLTKLTPSTTYTYMLEIDGEEIGGAETFTTAIGTPIPNGDFNYVSKVSGASYYKFYDPNCGVAEGQTKWWGSGNGEGSEGVNGSASMGIVITEPTEGPDGGPAVLAKSGSILGMLAAGNLFCGDFVGLVGTSGGKVNFGRPWNGARLSGVRLWVKYTAGKMDVVANNVPSEFGLKKNESYDRCQLKIALGTWDYRKYGGSKDCPVLCNTTDESTFVDFYTDPSTIANGELIIFGNGKQKLNGGAEETVANGEWRQVYIPLNYHTTTAYPTHIVISFAASMYGDYFSGSSDAKLYLDKVEAVYE